MLKMLAVFAAAGMALLMGGVAASEPPATTVHHDHRGSDGQQECLHEEMAADLDGETAYLVTEPVTGLPMHTGASATFDAPEFENMIILCERHSTVRDDGSGPSSRDHPDHEDENGQPTHPHAGEGIDEIAEDIENFNPLQRSVFKNADIVFQGRGRGYHVIHRGPQAGNGQTNDPDSPDGVIARIVACRIHPYYCR